MRIPINRAIVIGGGWTLFGLFMLGQSYVYRTQVGQSFDIPELLVREFAYAYVWALLTPLVLYLANHYRIGRDHWGRAVSIHVVSSVVVSVTHKIVSGSLHGMFVAMLGTEFSWTGQFQGILAYFDYGILIYWIILLMKYSLDYYRQYRETDLRSSQLETQLALAQLQALKMQLQPHFLFNTLNAISVLIDKDPVVARRTVGRLGDLLRLTLENSGVLEVPLKKELEFLDSYLQIEQTRFGDRLKVTFHIEDDVLDAMVPNMLLQPIVENSIKHGINRQRGPGLIEIVASEDNGALHVAVADNGAGLGGNGAPSTGVGLANTRARLEKLYGNSFRFEVTNRNEGGVLTTIELPLRRYSERNDP